MWRAIFDAQCGVECHMALSFGLSILPRVFNFHTPLIHALTSY